MPKIDFCQPRLNVMRCSPSAIATHLKPGIGEENFPWNLYDNCVLVSGFRIGTPIRECSY